MTKRGCLFSSLLFNTALANAIGKKNEQKDNLNTWKEMMKLSFFLVGYIITYLENSSNSIKTKKAKVAGC